MRGVLEFCVCLTIAVTLVRTFAAEGYVIETGSMAPCLLGNHRWAECTSCGEKYCVDESRAAEPAVCPNCGLRGIDVGQNLRNDGDQLLVFRAGYEYRVPRRWEVVVFRNPGQPTQAYVKRIAGLPGDAIQIIDGDVYVAGQIQTKSLATQRGMRIPVYDHDHRPPDDDPEWRPRWIPDGTGPQSPAHWRTAGGAFVYDDLEAQPPAEAARPPLSWLRYRHWVRRGGTHATSVCLPLPPPQVEEFASPGEPLTWRSNSNELVCHGAMPAELYSRLRSAGTTDGWQKTVDQLFEGSHIAPITDGYGYNRARDGAGANEVRDLMICFNLSIIAGQGEFALALSDGAATFECLFDVSRRQIRLKDVASEKVVRTARLPANLFPGPALVEFSLMDHQVALAVAGQELFEPWNSAAPQGRGPTPWAPVRIGARGLNLRVDGVRLFRDVYYTGGPGRRGCSSPVVLQPGEFFALGDNSPVSRDSRSWPEGKVLTRELLLGKPFLVHLPSRRHRLRFGRWQGDIRIPDLSRIRYIH